MPKLEDLVTFQRAVDLVVTIYDVTAPFPRQELYGLTSQLRRAGISLASNIAEGQGRLTPGERRQFLSQARGSLSEIEAQAIIAERLGFLTPQNHEAIKAGVQKTGRALTGFIRWVKSLDDKTASPRARATASPTHRSASIKARTSGGTGAENIPTGNTNTSACSA